VSKRWGRERERDDSGPSEELLEEMLGTMIPIACAGDRCEKRAHMVFPGGSPYEGGVFTGKGWTAVVADNPPAVNFLSPECFHKEVEQNHATSKPRAAVNSPVSR
jgi:ubiquitin-protein ligase